MTQKIFCTAILFILFWCIKFEASWKAVIKYIFKNKHEIILISDLSTISLNFIKMKLILLILHIYTCTHTYKQNCMMLPRQNSKQFQNVLLYCIIALCVSLTFFFFFFLCHNPPAHTIRLVDLPIKFFIWILTVAALSAC